MTTNRFLPIKYTQPLTSNTSWFSRNVKRDDLSDARMGFISGILRESAVLKEGIQVEKDQERN